jgi:hypothetical protein
MGIEEGEEVQITFIILVNKIITEKFPNLKSLVHSGT